jgi:hypothetical protein
VACYESVLPYACIFQTSHVKLAHAAGGVNASRLSSIFKRVLAVIIKHLIPPTQVHFKRNKHTHGAYAFISNLVSLVFVENMCCRYKSGKGYRNAKEIMKA